MAKDNSENLSNKTETKKPVKRLAAHLAPPAELLQLMHRLSGCEALDAMIEVFVAEVSHAVKADRSTLLMNDVSTDELFARYAQGGVTNEIRFPNRLGIAGAAFTSGEPILIEDAYQDPRFNQRIDDQTGYRTRSIMAVPLRTIRGKLIGVVQCLNKMDGEFVPLDVEAVNQLIESASTILDGALALEQARTARDVERQFLQIVSDMTSDLDLASLLKKVMGEARDMLSAERSTLFLNDEKRNELWSQVGEGLGSTVIRFPNHLGIAGAVFTSGKSINIPHAYADLRFNPSFDRQTGFFTRSILCVPVLNKTGRIIGVTQVLNKRGGPFTAEDEQRLRAFTAQIAIGLENAKLFADVTNMRNYNQSILESMSNGVITIDDEGLIATCNIAGARIMRIDKPEDILKHKFEEFFGGPNAWLSERIKRVEKPEDQEVAMDATLEFAGESISANVSVSPLIGEEEKKLGAMVMIEDISGEKRMRATMSRYMDPGLADQLLSGGQDALGGQSVEATIVFTDVRSFTTLTEALGAQGTVALLNEYFTLMVDCITKEGGMLDKFIGDAIMAAFGLPVGHGDDEDRAVRASIQMLTELNLWNSHRNSQGLPSVEMGIGINTDHVVSGNIGSPKRMDYTVIGDGVNLAARLEGACKEYSAKLLISESTFSRLKGSYRIREADKLIVKGKTKPVTIFEVLDHRQDIPGSVLMDMLTAFRAGLGEYREGNWDRAIKCFNEALKAHQGDELSRTYIARCEKLKLDPPKDWEGVFVMKSK